MKKSFLILIGLFLFVSINVNAQQTDQSGPPYSKARKVNETLYISGQIARDPASGKIINDNIKEATRQSMKNIEAILKIHKMKFKDVMMVQIYLKDLNDYDDVNETYRTFFEDEKFPARVCLEVSRIPGDSPIEISAIAETKADDGIDLP